MLDVKEIFGITDECQFETAALETFRFQAVACEPYRLYLESVGIEPAQVKCVAQIPFMPIELFKYYDVYCGGTDPEVVFTSSNTGGTVASRHPMKSLRIYEAAFGASFRTFYGEPSRWSIYALLPNYLEREGSSLVYMVDRLIAECGSGGFFLYDHEELLERMRSDTKPKILLGVSYALWDLAERYTPRLDDTIIMETGGMKGQREELPKSTFHKILCDAFGVGAIHSEYGMAELTSQAYSSGGGVFRAPAWMRIVIRDINDPFCLLPTACRGGVNIIDLANRYSCAFVQTQDVGRSFADGGFEIEGRIANSDIRGCNLLIQ